MKNDKFTRPSVSRRAFLATSVAAFSTASVLPRRVLGQGGVRRLGPNDRIQLAGIGVGGVGFGQLQACEREGFQIVALCDVDQTYARKAFDRWPDARRYRDFRELLQAEGDRIDAVYCGTPDHTHALITIAALRRKKHVCCVKPLTRTVGELRRVLQVAREAGVATQVTAAPNTSDEACRTCELIAAGAIGPVREVHIWSNRPVWPQGMFRPAGEDPVPEGFDWSLWLGPARHRPFKGDWPSDHYALAQMNLGKWDPGYRGVYHPFNFRGWWDFGTGALGDMGCHHFNTPFRGLQLGAPSEIHATATLVTQESAPLASMVVYDFPARQSQPPVRITWYDGGLRPPVPRELGSEELPEEGVLYVGDEGRMLGNRILDAARAERFKSVPRTLERRGGTWREWAQACRGGPAAGCDFDWAGPLTETVLLGNIALRTRERLRWDAAEGRFDRNEKANGLLEDPYHNGWSLDAV